MKQLLLAILVLITLNLKAQEYRSPLDIPLLLSANCGELRGNHFHSGIDIKTQGVTGKPVYSIEDGYVSRIAVSPSGYGLALYIDHPKTGHTSVYGHLQSFSPKIADYVKKRQYEKEAFRVDLRPKPSEFPLRKGDLIAYSGNSGSSGGPHLHFEIREASTQHVLDPLVYYKNMIRDTKSPEVSGVAVYPVPGRGVVNGSGQPVRQTISLTKDGTYTPLKEPFEVWGVVGLGIKSYDRMDGTSNVYGVKKVRLLVNGKQVFESETKKFSFNKTRMINSFTDYADWRNNKSFYMLSFIEPGNTLPFYESYNKGYINIDKEQLYDVKYELEDIYGNITTYGFDIIGRKQPIPTPSACSLVMSWDKPNRYISDQFTLIIDKGNLYNDVCFTLSNTPSESYYSPIYKVNKVPIPLDKKAQVSIALQTDPLANKQQYGIVQLKGNKESWIGGAYNNGVVTANIRELGLDLAISSDKTAPIITPVLPKKWIKDGVIKLKITDNLSGVSSFRGTIDGKYVLFEHDVKSNIYSYKLDATRLKKGMTHNLVMTATDACKNKTQFKDQFYY